MAYVDVIYTHCISQNAAHFVCIKCNYGLQYIQQIMHCSTSLWTFWCVFHFPGSVSDTVSVRLQHCILVIEVMVSDHRVISMTFDVPDEYGTENCNWR